MNVRLVAARVVLQVSEGQSLADCLPPVLATIKDLRDRALIQAMVYGVCRYYSRLDIILSYLLQKPMKAKDSDVHALLLVGLYQLTDMRIPSHAAVAETVNAAAKLKKPWARGFVNAILREYLRKQESITATIETEDEALYAHPQWWIEAIKKAWPQEWEKILSANNAHPPFALRVNVQKYNREKYVTMLPADCQSRVIPYTDSGMIVEPALPVENLPEFSQAAVSVQDGAAQLTAKLLELAPGQRVLDACAAPGGKLTHILEVEPKLAACIAVEKEVARMQSIQENLTRLQLQAECICADVGATKQWWDGKLFDRILLDAPCSASGVIRRHPDIKLLRELNDIKNLAKEQTRLLTALWPLLVPGGILLYATCSIFPEENAQILAQFLAKHPDAKEMPIDAEWGIACPIGRQILPGMHEMDGFYFARLIKK